MKISCVIPTCDRLDFLKETINSVLNQSLKPYEIIIVNNGKDKLKLSDELSQQVIIYNIAPYVGVAQARNFGAFISKGDYIAFIDDDDLWNKSYLENVNNALSESPDFVISRLDTLVNDEIKSFKNAHDKVSINNILVFNPGITGTNLVASKEAFFKLSGYDPKLPPSEDKTLILEALRANMKILTLPDNQAIIRVHNTGRLSDPEKMAEGIFQFTKKYSDLMNIRQFLTNWLKIYRYRYDSGEKKAFIPFVIVYLITRFIRLK